MRFWLLIFTCLLLPCGLILGQSGVAGGSEKDMLTRLLDEQEEGEFRIEVDSLLLSNYYKLITRNSNTPGVPGYRIRIFSDSGIGAKEEQQRVRARFLSLFPDVDAYYRYDEPFFKVYVGDCRTLSEALKLDDRVKQHFPNSIIREDYINIQ